jgi:hypothetical protein
VDAAPLELQNSRNDLITALSMISRHSALLTLHLNLTTRI